MSHDWGVSGLPRRRPHCPQGYIEKAELLQFQLSMAQDKVKDAQKKASHYR